jgi:hypothetical protein
LKKRYLLLLAALVVIIVAAPRVRSTLDAIRVDVPAYQRPTQIVKLDQNWSEEQRRRFHHTAQGTRLVPYEWFKALEQPCLSPFGCDLLTDPAYLSRFGFIPSEVDAQLNPDGLPIGFAIDRDFVDPVTTQTYPVVGLTCAACHTGELFYGDHAVQIEGAPASIEVTQFQKALGLAVAFNTMPILRIGRYARFERRVLGADATEAQKADLKARYDAFLTVARKEKEVTDQGRQPGVRRRHRHRYQLRGGQRAGALSPDLGCVVAQLGAVQLLDRRPAGS